MTVYTKKDCPLAEPRPLFFLLGEDNSGCREMLGRISLALKARHDPEGSPLPGITFVHVNMPFKITEITYSTVITILALVSHSRGLFSDSLYLPILYIKPKGICLALIGIQL